MSLSSMDFDVPHMAPRLNIAPIAWIGAAGAALLVAVFGIWAAQTQITGAVFAQGQAIVVGKPQVVQSLDGGAIAALGVSDGQSVEAGDVLITFDAAVAEANRDISHRRLAGALTRHARYRAESLGVSAPEFHYAPLPFPTPDTTSDEIDQTRIFEIRAQRRGDITEELSQTIAGLTAERRAATAQIAALSDQVASLDTDIARISSLQAQNLARRSDLARLERERFETISRLELARADLAGAMVELETAHLNARQKETAFREDVALGLAEAAADIDELTLEIVKLSETLRRKVIRAPVDGIVHDVQVSTVGAVVSPGETIMTVIPTSRGVEFEVQLNPADVDRAYHGQTADIVLSAIDPSGGLRLAGLVSRVSPDTVIDERTGEAFYRVGLSVPAEELAQVDSQYLVPGLPIEVYLSTGDRSVLTYLLAPFTAHLRRAFREDDGAPLRQ